MAGVPLTSEEHALLTAQARAQYDEAVRLGDTWKQQQAIMLLSQCDRIRPGTLLSDGAADCPIRAREERARVEARNRREQACREGLLVYLGVADADPNYGAPEPAGGISAGRFTAWLPPKHRGPRVEIKSSAAKRLAEVIRTCDRRLLFNAMVLVFQFRRWRVGYQTTFTNFDPASVTRKERGALIFAASAQSSWLIHYGGTFPLWLGGPTEEEAASNRAGGCR